MTARPVNPAKPGLSSEARSAKEDGRSGAPPSAMVEAVLEAMRSMVYPAWTMEDMARVAIAAMFDNLPREVMLWEAWRKLYGYDGEAFNVPKVVRDHLLAVIDAAISAARAEVLGSAKGDA